MPIGRDATAVCQSTIAVDVIPTSRIETLTDARQLSGQYGTTYFALAATMLAHVLERVELAGLADLQPALDQKFGIQRTPALSIEFFELFPDLDGHVPARIDRSVFVDGTARRAQRQVETLKRIDGPVELIAQRLDRLCVLDFRPSDARQQFRLVGCKIVREGG